MMQKKHGAAECSPVLMYQPVSVVIPNRKP
jgi:hypothetical protein